MQTLTQHWLIPKDRKVHIDLIGCLKDSKIFAEDAVENQRRLRDEWV